MAARPKIKCYFNALVTLSQASHNNSCENKNIAHSSHRRAVDSDSNVRSGIEETGMTNCNPVATPGLARYEPTLEDEALLDHEQHVGKLR